MPIHAPNKANQPYRPSNGTEGMIFEERFCHYCRHVANCEIPLLAMTHDLQDPEYPPQWRFDAGGFPTCTDFEDRIHGKDH